MDILYVIGRGSANGNRELRWSLRSLEKHGGNIGRVAVVGFIPEWLSDEVVKCPYDDRFKRKSKNILDAVFHACDEGAVKGEFMYSSDDHFLVRDVDLNRYPYYYKNPEIHDANHYLSKGEKMTNYRWMMAETRQVLEEFGVGIVEFSGHVNTHMDSRDVPMARSIVESRDTVYGPEPTCLMMNLRDARDPVKRVFRNDIKVYHCYSEQEFLNEVGSADSFSIGDSIFSREQYAEDFDFVGYMERNYGDKCRWEK